MSYKILAINPGSTSTKAALFEDKEMLFEMTLRHSAEELSRFHSIIDQLQWRHDLIEDALKQKGFNIKELSAVVGRGGLVKPIEGGVYEVNDRLVEDTKNAVREHASNLGALIARTIADEIGVKAYIADPVVVDELKAIARISGHPLIPRTSMFHALNSKAIARAYAEEQGVEYESLNLIVVHMGGGVSVSMHRHGRVVDTTNALSGDGCFSPERAGRLEPMALVDLCFSGKYTLAEVQKLIIGHGGLMAHMGTNSMQDVVTRSTKNDEKAKLILDAFCYNVSKDVGAMSTAVFGMVDAILITGGIAYSEIITDAITERCKTIAPVKVYPGENELGSLAENALNAMTGTKITKVYL